MAETYRGYSVWRIDAGETWIIAAKSLSAAKQYAQGDDVSDGDDWVREEIREADWEAYPMDRAVRIDGESNEITAQECIDEELAHDAPRDAFLVASTLF